jgi:MFS family permease
MARFLIYIFPALMDVVVGAMIFVTIERMTSAGRSAFQVGMLTCSWAVVYSIASFIIGRITTKRNAAWIIILAALGTSLTSICFIIFPSLNLQYLFIGFIGLFTAMFFCPFQVFMRAVEDGKPAGVRRSTALYTFSWSFGMACGPFLSGFIIQWGAWQGCHIMDAAIGLIVCVGIYLMKHHADEKPKLITAKTANEPEESTKEYANLPDLAWLGWIFAGVGCFSVAIIRSFFQYRAEPLGIPKAEQGTVLALVSFSQAFTALALGRFHFWMYQRLLPLILTVCGGIGLLIFGLATQVEYFYVAAVLYGLFSSSFFFYFVFHSLVHPERSTHYISINEVVVGVTSIAAPIIGGIIADATNSGTPFWVMVPLIGVAGLLQLYIHNQKRIKVALAESMAANG